MSSEQKTADADKAPEATGKSPKDPFASLKAAAEKAEAKQVVVVHPGDAKATPALRVDH